MRVVPAEKSDATLESLFEVNFDPGVGLVLAPAISDGLVRRAITLFRS